MRIFLSLVAVLLLFSGCDFNSGDENSHPLYIKGARALHKGKPRQAVKYFTKYLTVRPNSAKAHLKLAAIYDENLSEPLKAVFHYEAYLELEPRSPEASNVRKWLEAARKEYYYKTRLAYNDPENVAALQNQLYGTEKKLAAAKTRSQQLMQAVAACKQYIATQNQTITALKHAKSESGIKLEVAVARQKKLLEQLEQQKNKIVELENKVSELAAGQISQIEPVDAKEVKTEVPKPPETEKSTDKVTEIEPRALPHVEDIIMPKKTPATPPETKPAVKAALTKKSSSPEKDFRTYVVQRWDTLTKISRKFYGSSKHYELIFSANRDILATTQSLKPGQTLKIPPLKRK